ncbi:hypothetical protein HLB44_02430 [Aquincola sp. S2]|uniref:Porin n=1 Tax=Pseudaquabacterium terrae TaxID=2732868 RepID=A0ABX2EB93_9BURK|nr:hypothetical protein [Aquabacterium terrae]NRF65836.1 hypothetical protein [Aquabacterium terrae]
MPRALIRTLFLLWLAALGSAPARAEPYLALDQGYKCLACHVNITGGGLRNGLGAFYSQNTMAATKLPEGVPAWSGRLASWLRVGGDLRYSSSRSRVPGEVTQSDKGLDHARLYADVEVVADLLAVYVDQHVRPGEPQRQEAHVRLGGADRGWYAKAGQFYLPFGWRLQDNTAFVRSVSGISMTTPDKGVELGLEKGDWSAQLAYTRGPGNVGPTVGHQWTAQGVWVQPWGRLGTAVASTDSTAGYRNATAIFGGLLTGPVVWLGEIDLVRDNGFPEGRRKLVAALGEVNWKIRQGHNLKASAEYFDPDRRISNDHRVRHSLVYELTPIPFVQLRAGYRRFGGIPQSPVDNRRLMFVELHAFL